jgi:pseudaminic acid biosynthesis-associated methylase
MSKFKTKQEEFWAGKFGVDYISRNQGEVLLASNLRFFSNSLKRAKSLESCIEFGANIGMNLRALSMLYPKQVQHAIEINPEAAAQLAKVIPSDNVMNQSIIDFEPSFKCDLVLIKGVLIHVNPNFLPEIYDSLIAACGRYLLIAEYYNPEPVGISYRGHGDKLFKRDFAGEIMDRHPKMTLVDYGFAYHRDPSFPQDDITWFLLEAQ